MKKTDAEDTNDGASLSTTTATTSSFYGEIKSDSSKDSDMSFGEESQAMEEHLISRGTSNATNNYDEPAFSRDLPTIAALGGRQMVPPRRIRPTAVRRAVNSLSSENQQGTAVFRGGMLSANAGNAHWTALRLETTTLSMLTSAFDTVPNLNALDSLTFGAFQGELHLTYSFANGRSTLSTSSKAFRTLASSTLLSMKQAVLASLLSLDTYDLSMGMISSYSVLVKVWILRTSSDLHGCFSWTARALVPPTSHGRFLRSSRTATSSAQNTSA